MEVTVVAVHDLSQMSSLGGIRASKPKGSNEVNGKSLVMPSFVCHTSVGQNKRCQLFARFFCDDKGRPLPLTQFDKSSTAEGKRLLVPLGRDPNENVGVIPFRLGGDEGPLLSRKHCVLELSWCPPNQRLHNDQWCAIRVYDGGSLNGTFVNNKRLAPSESSVPVPFNPRVSSTPLLTLEFGVGSKLAPGAPLPSAALKLQFQVFARCLQKGHVEWIEHRLGGQAFALERLREVGNTNCLARADDSVITNTTQNLIEEDGLHVLPSPREFSPSVGVNDSKAVQVFTQWATQDVLDSIVHTHSIINSKGLTPSASLPVPLCSPEPLAVVEGPAPNDSATVILDAKENVPPLMSHVKYADSCAHAKVSKKVPHDIVKINGRLGQEGDDDPVLVVRKKNLTDSPKACVVTPPTQGEFHLQHLEKNKGANATPIDVLAGQNVHMDAEGLSLFLLHEEGLTVALPRRGAPKSDSQGNNDIDDIIVSQSPLAMSPRAGKGKTNGGPISRPYKRSGVASAGTGTRTGTGTGTGTACGRKRRRGVMDATETVKLFVAELLDGGKENQCREVDNDVPGNAVPYPPLRNTTRPVVKRKTGVKRVSTTPTVSARNTKSKEVKKRK